MHTYRIHKILSVSMIGIGALLMTYMILVEDEPGGIPLLLILAGAVWNFVARTRIRSRDEPS